MSRLRRTWHADTAGSTEIMLTDIRTPSHTPTARARGLRRPLAVAGALAIALAAVLPWVTVKGRLPLDLDLLNVEVSAGGMTVSGVDTAAWPYLLGVAVVACLLAAFGLARRLLLGIGVLAMIAGAGLFYYLSNVVDFEMADRTALERTAADLVVSASVGPGPFVLLGAGVCLILATIGGGARRG